MLITVSQKQSGISRIESMLVGKRKQISILNKNVNKMNRTLTDIGEIEKDLKEQISDLNSVRADANQDLKQFGILLKTLRARKVTKEIDKARLKFNNNFQ